MPVCMTNHHWFRTLSSSHRYLGVSVVLAYYAHADLCGEEYCLRSCGRAEYALVVPGFSSGNAINRAFSIRLAADISGYSVDPEYRVFECRNRYWIRPLGSEAHSDGTGPELTRPTPVVLFPKLTLETRILLVQHTTRHNHGERHIVRLVGTSEGMFCRLHPASWLAEQCQYRSQLSFIETD